MDTVTVGSICRARSQMVAVAYLFFTLAKPPSRSRKMPSGYFRHELPDRGPRQGISYLAT